MDLLDKKAVEIIEEILRTGRRIVKRHEDAIAKLKESHATYTEDTLTNLLGIKLSD